MTDSVGRVTDARPRLATSLGIGTGAGVLSGLFGVGGGFVIVPALTSIAGLSHRRASGTSLVAVIPISAAAAFGYALDGYVDVFVAGLLVAGGLVGAEIGTRLLNRLPIRTIRLCFAALLFVAAARLMLGSLSTDPMRLGLAVDGGRLALGVGTGVLSGLLGVGGGFVMVPGMVLLSSMPAAMAKGTSLAAIIPTAAFATWRNTRRGNADVKLGLTVGAAGAVFSLFAARVFVGLDPKLSNVLLALLLLTLAASMVVAAFRSDTADPRNLADPAVSLGGP